MPKFVHVDIAADKPQRAAEFYAKVFGWNANKLGGPEPYWLLSPSASGDPNAVGAGIGKRSQPWQTVAPTIDVDSVDAYAKKIENAGGSILVPRIDMPGVGALVTFKDTEGNILSILEPSADNRFAAGGPG
jgi:predicted enzyme related to lactoylglutathione lyase